jgi:hypothetical protein
LTVPIDNAVKAFGLDGGVLLKARYQQSQTRLAFAVVAGRSGAMICTVVMPLGKPLEQLPTIMLASVATLVMVQVVVGEAPLGNAAVKPVHMPAACTN